MDNLKHLIPGQVSPYINENYPNFVLFLQAYYEWLSTPDSPFYHLKNHLSYMDFEKSLDEYTALMKNEYLQSIPERVLANKELLIKYSKQFYQTVGTEKAFKFLFRILYNEEIDIYYPRDDMLIASNGKWVTGESIVYVSDTGNAESFLYRQITQTREPFPGVFETATANVTKVVKRYANNFIFAELSVTDIDGTFDINYPVMLGDQKEWILPVGASYEIIDAGTNYQQDNFLEYSGDPTFNVSVVSTEAGVVDTKYPTLYTAMDLIVTRNGNPLTGFTYNRNILQHPDIVAGDTITITYPIYPGFLFISEVAQNGSVKEINIYDTPFGITSPQQYVGSVGGVGCIIEVKPGLSKAVGGYYINSDGFLSDKDKLQDSDYVQDFSYVIRSGQDIERYRDVVLSVLHPAGFKMLGEVNILEVIKLMIREHTFNVELRPQNVFLVDSASELYTRNFFLDDFKHKLGWKTYKIGNFEDMVVGDIYDLPFAHINMFDTKIDLTIDAPYVEDDYVEDGYFGDTVKENQ